MLFNQKIYKALLVLIPAGYIMGFDLTSHTEVLREVRRQYDNQQYDSAISIYRGYTKNHGKDVENEEIVPLIIKAMIKKRDYALSKRLLAVYENKFPNSPYLTSLRGLLDSADTLTKDYRDGLTDALPAPHFRVLYLQCDSFAQAKSESSRLRSMQNDTVQLFFSDGKYRIYVGDFTARTTADSVRGLLVKRCGGNPMVVMFRNLHPDRAVANRDSVLQNSPRYLEKSGNFSYIIPHGWMQKRLQGQIYWILGRKDEDNSCNVIFLYEFFTENLSKFVDASIINFKKVIPSMSILYRNTFTTSDGETGTKLIIIGKSPAGTPIRQAAYFFALESKVFTMVATTPSTYQGRFDDDFDAIAQSLSFVQVPTIHKQIPSDYSCSGFTRKTIDSLFKAIESHERNKVKAIIARNAAIVQCNDSRGMSPLFVASATGDSSIVLMLLCNNADVNIGCGAPNTASPLIIAAQNGHVTIVNILCAHNADITARDALTGSTALHIAAAQGHAKIVSLLLASGAPVNDKALMSEVTPFYSAAQGGHLEICTMLHSRGANIEERAKSGATPLYIASQKGHFAIVRYLIEQNADIHACIDGKTALWVARMMGHSEIAEFLTLKGAKESCK